MTARENILMRLKNAQDKRKVVPSEQPDMEAPIYVEDDKDLTESFRENLEPLGGVVFRVEDLEEAAGLIGQLSARESWPPVFCADETLRQAMAGRAVKTADPEEFYQLRTAVTPCEFLVAHTGSVMVSSGGASGRRLHVFPETHIVVAHNGQLVRYLHEALDGMQRKYPGGLPSVISNITGPSRTADIEKTLVKGMHGPRKIFVILCNQSF